MKVIKLVLGLLMCLPISASAPAQGARLLRHPTVSRDAIRIRGRPVGGVASRWAGAPSHFRAGRRDRSILFTGRISDRLHRDRRGEHRRLRCLGRGRRSQAVDLSPGPRSRARLDSRWPARDLRIGAGQRAARVVLPSLDHRPRRRTAPTDAAASRIQRRVLARRPPARLRRNYHSVYTGMVRSQPVETLSRRPHASDTNPHLGRLLRRETSVE